MRQRDVLEAAQRVCKVKFAFDAVFGTSQNDAGSAASRVGPHAIGPWAAHIHSLADLVLMVVVDLHAVRPCRVRHSFHTEHSLQTTPLSALNPHPRP